MFSLNCNDAGKEEDTCQCSSVITPSSVTSRAPLQGRARPAGPRACCFAKLLAQRHVTASTASCHPRASICASPPASRSPWQYDVRLRNVYVIGIRLDGSCAAWFNIAYEQPDCRDCRLSPRTVPRTLIYRHRRLVNFVQIGEYRCLFSLQVAN